MPLDLGVQASEWGRGVDLRTVRPWEAHGRQRVVLNLVHRRATPRRIITPLIGGGPSLGARVFAESFTSMVLVEALTMRCMASPTCARALRMECPQQRTAGRLHDFRRCYLDPCVAVDDHGPHPR